MREAAITIERPRSVQVRLTEGRDAAYVAANEFHFDLQLGVIETITPALREGVNVVRFVVTTTRFREKVLNLALDRPQWAGRFELYLNGDLVSVFADHGAALLGGGVYEIARLNMQIVRPIVAPPASELTARLRRVPGMTDTVPTDVAQAQLYTRFRNQVALLTWKNRFGVDFVYVCEGDGTCLYAGYVGWLHAGALRHELQAISDEFREAIL